jgi:hypothetical protein
MAASWQKWVQQYSGEYGVDPKLVNAVIRQESGGNPNATSGAGAGGLMQLMPGTAAGLGVGNVYDPKQNIRGGVKYLSQQLNAFGGDIDKALAAYNAGPGAVRKYGGIPPYKETQGYVKKVRGYYGNKNPQAIAYNRPQQGQQYITQTVQTGGIPQDKLAILSQTSNLPGGYDFFRRKLEKKYPVRQQKIQIPIPGMPGHYTGDGHNHGGAVGATAPTSFRGRNLQDIMAPSQKQRGWQWLQQVGQKYFGLRNDPGTSQTVGGGHTSGSRHYSGMAIDFGDARNTREQLNAWYRWALGNKQKYGFREVLDEGDHIHVAF